MIGTQEPGREEYSWSLEISLELCCLSSECQISTKMIKQGREVIKFPLQKAPSEDNVKNDLLRITDHMEIYSFLV